MEGERDGRGGRGKGGGREGEGREGGLCSCNISLKKPGSLVMVFDTDYQCDRRTNSTTVGLYAVTVLVFVCCGKTEPQEPARINQEWTGLC